MCFRASLLYGYILYQFFNCVERLCLCTISLWLQPNRILINYGWPNQTGKLCRESILFEHRLVLYLTPAKLSQETTELACLYIGRACSMFLITIVFFLNPFLYQSGNSTSNNTFMLAGQAMSELGWVAMKLQLCVSMLFLQLENQCTLARGVIIMEDGSQGQKDIQEKEQWTHKPLRQLSAQRLHIL